MVDSVTLSVTDGINSVTNTIDIDLRSDQHPSFVDGLERRLEVFEGDSVTLNLRNLAATDDVVDADQLTFHILQQPQFGEIRVDGTSSHRFTQRDVALRSVQYAHTSGEIGHSRVSDLVTVTVSDRELEMEVSSPVPLIDIEFDILPRDNSPPRLVVSGPVMISGSQAAAITPAVLSARDDDSLDKELTFVVAQTPMWGFLERSKTSTRSGRSQTSRRVSTFTLTDLREGTVQYVPSNLSKGGPPSDSFSVYVTDGKNRSPLGHIEVAVLPPSVSLPDFFVEDIKVREGGRNEVEVRISGEQDTENAERLVVSMAEAPVHGRVILETGTSADQPGIMEIEMRDISIADLRSAGVRIVYQQDGSESAEDSFAPVSLYTSDAADE